MPTTLANRNNILIAIIFIFHLVGVIGFLTKPDLFEPLSPLNLILSVILILLANTNNTWKFYVSLLLVATIGFLVEVIGVKTHLVFGNYWYGNSFGFLLLGVPLLIGVNWAFLTYGTAQFCNFKNKYINSVIGAILMVGLDFFIEQNAATYHFWYWEITRYRYKITLHGFSFPYSLISYFNIN